MARVEFLKGTAERGGQSWDDMAFNVTCRSFGDGPAMKVGARFLCLESSNLLHRLCLLRVTLFMGLVTTSLCQSPD